MPRTSGFRSTPVLREAITKLSRDGDDVFPFRSQSSDKTLSRTGATNHVLLMPKKAGGPLSMHRLRKGFDCRVAEKLGKRNAPVLHKLMRHGSMHITMDYYASVGDAIADL